MCVRYLAPAVDAVAAVWPLRPDTAARWGPGATVDAFRSPLGPFVRAGGELAVGRFGLIPPWSETPLPKGSTYNARAETVAEKPSFRAAWARGQRCIVPAASFDEPNWESGRNVWWRLRRADGLPWGLAGLWHAWIDRATGEVHESFALLTVNVDAHPLLRRLHKPDPKLPADAQDKRTVATVDPADAERWLGAAPADAMALLRVAPPEAIAAGPAEPSAGPRPPTA